MAVAGCINAYDCAGCYLTTLQQLQSDNIGVAINYTAPGEYGRRQLDYIKYTDKCGCTCCLTGENELRIVATQGVIKNFTLTNDDTNEVVNVKWNDLFGSNRAYTMVRYKTGSYPTSITDGTLAVKETTQNQYSVSGYNVSGLTDGTTYYFTAFAVSQDDTIIAVQSGNITTDFAFAGFQRVEYIQSSGSQYIDTGFKPTGNSEIEFDFETISGTPAGLFGVDSNWTVNAFSVFTDRVFCYGDQYIGNGGTIYFTPGTKYKLEFKSLKCYLNSSLQYTFSSRSFTSSYSAYLFAKRRNNTIEMYAKEKVYGLKLRNNGKLVRDMYPVYRKSDNVIGMLDIKNKVFYTNSGSGTFTKGSNIPR